MNNGFPGSSTPVGHNKELTCQPNFNGPKPGHCVLHHVDAAPVPNVSRQIVSAQNSGMNFLMSAQNQQAMARFSQQQNSQIAAAKSITAMVARLADEAAKKPAAKAPVPAAKPAAKASAPAVKPATHPPAQKSEDFSLSTLVSHNFLSNEQQAQKSKELAECQTAMCTVGKNAQWAITDLARGTSFAAGILAGAPAGLYDTVDGIVKTSSNPAEAYSALKSLVQNGNILDNLGSAVKQSWTDSIDRMEAEYQKNSISGAFNAGVEGGKLRLISAGW